MAGKSADERIEARKKQQKTMIGGIAAVVIIILVLAAGFILLKGGPGGGSTVTYSQSQTDPGGQNVLIPLADVTDTAFHFYSYNSSGTAINYFVVKDASGSIHTAFDACDVCFRAKKGYSQAGDNAQCNNCGKTFAVADIGTKNTAGGCWPSYLPHEIQGDNIVIKSSDLAGGKYLFA